MNDFLPRRISIVFIAMLFATVSSVSAVTAVSTFDRSAWQQDFAWLKRSLESRYANLAWKGSGAGGVDVPELARETDAALGRATSDEAAAAAIRAFVAGFRDGHLSELHRLASMTADAFEPPTRTLDPRDAAGGCAALGFASVGATAFSMPFESLPSFTLLSDGATSTFRSGLLRPRPDVVLGLVRIHAFRPRAFPVACSRAWAAMFEAGTPLTPRGVRAEAERVWFDDLASTLKALEAAGARAILIDVGNNSGGDDSGDWTARLLSGRPVRSARLAMVDAPIAAGYFDEQIAALRDARAEAAAPAISPCSTRRSLSSTTGSPGSEAEPATFRGYGANGGPGRRPTAITFSTRVTRTATSQISRVAS